MERPRHFSGPTLTFEYSPGTYHQNKCWKTALFGVERIMVTALITGGLGFIGSFIARELVQTKTASKVVLFDNIGGHVPPTQPYFFDYRYLRTKPIQKKVVLERGDCANPVLLFEILLRHRPAYIFHLAGLPLAKLMNLNPIEAQKGSVESTANLLEAVHRLRAHGYPGPKKFIYASSSMVYGNFLEDPASEEHPTQPIEVYGTMKLAGEVVTRGLCHFYKIPFAIVRPSAVYGPTDMNQRVTQKFVEKAFQGKAISIQGRDESLDFTYVKDVAMGFRLAAVHSKADGETFNITSGRAQTLLQFAECLKKHFPRLRTRIEKRDAFRPRRGTLSIQKATKILGYRPRFTLQAGVDEYVRFVRAHNPFIQKARQ